MALLRLGLVRTSRKHANFAKSGLGLDQCPFLFVQAALGKSNVSGSAVVSAWQVLGRSMATGWFVRDMKSNAYSKLGYVEDQLLTAHRLPCRLGPWVCYRYQCVFCPCWIIL
jgi:hypothetical protein